MNMIAPVSCKARAIFIADEFGVLKAVTVLAHKDVDLSDFGRVHRVVWTRPNTGIKPSREAAGSSYEKVDTDALAALLELHR